MKKCMILFVVCSSFLTACGFDVETTSTKSKSAVVSPSYTPVPKVPSLFNKQKLLCNRRQETAADYQTCGDRCAAQNGGDRSYILCEYAWNNFTRRCELRAACGSLPGPQ